MKESSIIEPGKEILPPFTSPLGKIGSMICFDLRFPEIALTLKRQGADILLYPSAFTPQASIIREETFLRKHSLMSLLQWSADGKSALVAFTAGPSNRVRGICDCGCSSRAAQRKAHELWA